jgi:hypothetical protein
VDQLRLENVRLSFPDLWEAKKVGDGEPKFSAAFLLDKKEHEDLIAQCKTIAWAAAKEHFKDKAKDLIAKKKLTVFFHEGSEKDYEGYGDHNMYISASSKRRPVVMDRDKTPLVESDGRPYAGCYVNAVVRIWVQDNQYGKRINAELMGVQFVRDGEAFGAAPLGDDAFENLDEKEGKGSGKKAADKSKTSKAAAGDHEPEPEPSEEENPL